MPANHPNPRRLLGIIALVVLLLAFVPAVSAEELTEEIINVDLYNAIDTSKSGSVPKTGDSGGGHTGYFNSVIFRDITLFAELSYLDFVLPGNHGRDISGNYLDSGRYEFTYNFNGADRPGVIYISRATNLVGTVTLTKYTIFLNDWDIGTLTGDQFVVLPFQLYNGDIYNSAPVWVWDVTPTDIVLSEGRSYVTTMDPYTYQAAHVSGIPWKNHLSVSKTFEGIPGIPGYQIILNRTIENKPYTSTITLYNDENPVFVNTDHGNNLTTWIPVDEINRIVVTDSQNKNYEYFLGSGEPGEPGDPDIASVTVYVRNSQTGALLGDAHIIIKDTTTDPWTEVVNQTLPSGHGTISLAKDPGIHLTQYQISATVPGYQQVVPALFFRVVGPMDVIVEMEPVEGGPVNEANTYLEFYVRDLNANGISNAQVFVDGKMRWTNAAGYTQIEVAKNASYPYSVSKSGYVTIEGTATVGDGPRYTVNVVLGPKEIPTYTPDPGETPGGPGATPTPDRRTNEEKGQAVIDMLADNAEGLGALALICLMFGLLKLMVKW